LPPAHGGLPVFIAEWGSVAYANNSVRVNWIQQMQSFVAANPSIHATLYWDSRVLQCNYIINNSSTSLSALASMGQSPMMQGKPA
jgi:Cellulase (glycosyl hydrolase family 5).